MTQPKFDVAVLERQYLSALKSGDTIMATVYSAFLARHA